MHVRLVKSFGFEAAHWLPTFPEGHKCRRMHGHSFRVEVVVEGEVPPESGYLIDYGDIQTAIDPVFGQLDHRCLNDIEGLENPTSEVLADWLWQRLKPGLPLLAGIVVQETCAARCEYRGPGPSPRP
jgi:6-pyruvoyltetrahydropterin/6-carboxytetrahydropterin synthase